MDGFCSFPWVGQGFIGGSADVTRDQAVHGLCYHVCGGLTCTCDLRDLRVPDSLLVAVDLEGCKHVDLLNQ